MSMLFIYLSGLIACMEVWVYLSFKEDNKIIVLDVLKGLVIGIVGSWLGFLLIGGFYIVSEYGDKVIYKKK